MNVDVREEMAAMLFTDGDAEDFVREE